MPQLVARRAHGGHHGLARFGVIIVHILIPDARRRRARVLHGHRVLVHLDAVHLNAVKIVLGLALLILPLVIDDRAVRPCARVAVRLIPCVHGGVQTRQCEHDGQLRRIDAPVPVLVVGGKVHLVLHRRHGIGKERRHVGDGVVLAVLAVIDARRQAPVPAVVFRAGDGQLCRHHAVIGSSAAFLCLAVGKLPVGVLPVKSRDALAFVKNLLAPLRFGKAALHIAVIHADEEQRDGASLPSPLHIFIRRRIGGIMRHLAAERIVVCRIVVIIAPHKRRKRSAFFLAVQRYRTGCLNILFQRAQPALQAFVALHHGRAADGRIAIFRDEIAAQRIAAAVPDDIAQASCLVRDDDAPLGIRPVGKELVAAQIARNGFTRRLVPNGGQPGKRRNRQRAGRYAQRRQPDEKGCPSPNSVHSFIHPLLVHNRHDAGCISRYPAPGHAAGRSVYIIRSQDNNCHRHTRFR